MSVTSSSLCIGYMRNICLYAKTLSRLRSLSMAASVSPARMRRRRRSAARFQSRGSSGHCGRVRTRANAVMLLPFLDDRVVTAFQVRLLLHEFENPSLVRQRSRLRLVCHLWPALCMHCRTRLRPVAMQKRCREMITGLQASRVVRERQSYSAGAVKRRLEQVIFSLLAICKTH